MDRKTIYYAGGGVLCLIIFYLLFLSPPDDFPVGATFRVERGSSLRSVSSMLKKDSIINSRAAFEFFVILFGKEKNIISADYTFEKKLPVFEVARRIGRGAHMTAPVSVTIPEGFNTEEIAGLFALKLQNFSKEEFLVKAKSKEGYLFPDTYFFLTNADEDIAIKSMSDNFEKKIAPLMPEISTSGKSKSAIIIMASILERESDGDKDRGIISGILWRRISIGMPLQVDAFPDTYKTKGLPKAPIGNPGLEAIRAAIHPQSSPYLYYLHDKEGNIYYARTFVEHTKNITKYLK